MKTYKCVGIGNAVMDMIAQCDDAVLAEHGIDKGVMQLIDRDRAEALSGVMQNPVQMAGGSVANTIAGMGALGLKTAFIGRVADDEAGRAYAASMAKEGIDFVNAPVAHADQPTSRSMIFVSPDGERSMNTYLGISGDLDDADVPAAVVSDAEILLLEGYLFDKQAGKDAFLAAAKAARQGGGRAGISLSDPFCVDRHRDDFRQLICELDYVIGNEDEWLSLYQTDDIKAALAKASDESNLVVCTRSGKEVHLRQGDQDIIIPVTRIEPLDTTGAGDQFAAGFLYGLATGASLAVCGQMGCIAASEVITHYGARPEADVAGLFKKAGLV